MTYPVAYRSGAAGFQNAKPPIRGGANRAETLSRSRPSGYKPSVSTSRAIVRTNPKPNFRPLARPGGFGFGAARTPNVPFGKVGRASIAASEAMLERGALSGAARLLPRLVPWLGLALTAYDLWQLYRDLAVFPEVDMQNYGYVRTVVCATYHEFAKETQPSLCTVQGGSGPGFSPANPRPRRYGTWRRNLNGVGWFGHESYIRPLTDPLPNGYRPAWSTPRANPYRPPVASPGIGVPALAPAPSRSPAMVPFVWAPPGVGPHPGDLPNDFPIHIPAPRWVLPHLARSADWPQWREEGYETSPSMRQINSGRVVVDAAVGAGASASPQRVSPTPGRVPPKPKEREKKLRAKSDGVRIALGRAIGAYTEVSDFVDALYTGLPSKLRKKLKKDGKARNPYERAKAIWDNLDQMNWDRAVWGVIKDQLTDAAIGRLYAGAQRGAANIDPAYQLWRRISF